MSVFRVNKNKNYIVMSNYHLKEKRMSLKAKGLLSEMLSLPDEWDYSISGLVAINKENETSIKTTLDELKHFKYLVVTKLLPNETKSGRIEYIYDIYEKPQKQEVEKQGVENLGVEFLGVEFQGLENQGQYNINNKNINNKNINNKIYKKYGTYKRIKLTDKEYENLVKEYGEDFIKQRIELLDEYIETNNNKNKYTNFNLVLRKSIRENWFDNKKELPNWFNKDLNKKDEIEESDLTDEQRDTIKRIIESNRK